MRCVRIGLCASAFMVCAVGDTVLAVASGADGTSVDVTRARFSQMERDIPSLYLLNGLNLARGQAAALSKLLARVADAEQRLVRESEKVMARRAQDMDREVEDIVKLAAQRCAVAARIDTPLRGGRMADAQQELWAHRSAYDAVANAAAGEACALLTPAQGRILDSFKPCFIPANDFRNPERVGQASSDTTVAEQALTRVRGTADGAERNKAVDAALDVLVPHVMYERHMTFSPERAQAVRKELRPLVEGAARTACNLSAADFELEKKRLAQILLPAADAAARKSAADIWKVRRYLLNTSICDVVKDRAEGVSTPRATCTPAGDARDLAARRREYLRAAALLGELEISKDQAARLLPIAAGAVKVVSELDAKALAAMEAAEEPYGRLRSELACGQPTPRSESGAGGFHHQVKVLRDDERVARLLGYEAELDKVLTRAQVALLMSDRPAWQDLPPEQARAARAQAQEDRKTTMDAARRLLSDARRMSARAFAKEQDALCRELIAASAESGQVADASTGTDAEVTRMLTVLERARGLKRADYANRREELATELCPKLTAARPAAYTARFNGNQPEKTLWSSTRIMLSEPACQILARMAN